MNLYSKLNYSIRNRITNVSGFGLIEAILSILLLTILITFSLSLVSMRQSTLYNANLTRAISDEIRRDIERLKIELWNEHYHSPQNQSTAFYLTGTKSNPNYYCEDILRTFVRLPSWNNKTWTPGADSKTQSGQIRNRIFQGKPISITRNVSSKRPFNIGTSSYIDNSVAEIVYSVNKGTEKFHWTSIYLNSEAHGWCSPNSQ